MGGLVIALGILLVTLLVVRVALKLIERGTSTRSRAADARGKKRKPTSIRKN